MLWTLRRGKRGRAAACMSSRFKGTVAEGLAPQVLQVRRPEWRWHCAANPWHPGKRTAPQLPQGNGLADGKH